MRTTRNTVGVGKQNLTVQLDLETVRRAEVIAAERGLSMSALVSHLRFHGPTTGRLEG